jgi:hypothetical protein
MALNLNSRRYDMVKLIAGYHLTALDRAALQQMRDKGAVHAKTARKHFRLIPDEPGQYKAFITTNEKNDYGQPIERVSVNIVSFT